MIFSSQRIRLDPINNDGSGIILGNFPEFITKHFNGQFSDSYCKGYFRFGTLFDFRAKEISRLGRLGDYQEARLQYDINSRSGKYKSLSLGNVNIKNISISNSRNQVTHEFTSNDFCCCFSTGPFSRERARKMSESEKGDENRLTHYVTYRTGKIFDAAKFELRKRTNKYLIPIGAPIDYTKRDVSLNFKNSVDLKITEDVKLWRSICFAKSYRFQHEDEYRILFCDPNHVGGLDCDQKPVEINENLNIRNSIEDMGTI